MGRNKILLVAILIAVLVAGWGAAYVTTSNTREINEQEGLESQADQYCEKGLYVRAIPLYAEAAAIRTDDSRVNSIEQKLLSAYLQHGDIDEYVNLLNQRDEKATAEEVEYLTAASFYDGGYAAQKQAEILKKGLKRFPDSMKLKEAYDKAAYLYSMQDTEYTELKPVSGTVKAIPAFDGTVWRFINFNGWAISDHTYDTVTPFSAEGYAAVQKEGKTYVINEDEDDYAVSTQPFTALLGVQGTHVLACLNGKYGYYQIDDLSSAASNDKFQFDSMAVNSDGVTAVKKGNHWSVITDKGETVIDYTLDDAAVNSLGNAFCGGVAMLEENGKWYLFNSTGEKVTEEGFANAKAPEEKGAPIAVANDEGKWGFIDQKGNLIVDYQYDDAASFSDGLGAVSSGNSWNYITENNYTAVDVGLMDASPFHNGYAVGKNDSGNAVLITLQYCSERDDS